MREDWIEVELGDVLYLKNGYAFKSTQYKNEGIPIIRISDINQGVVRTKNSVMINQSVEYDNYQVQHGDILIAMSGATTGKFGIFKDFHKAYQNQRVGNLRLHSDILINKLYIYYLLYSLRHIILQESYGGAQPNISANKIEAINVWISPLPEQRAIVSKIEELFSELDSGVANLKKAKEKLEIYRQAVLKKAFEGELTKEWRERQVNLPTADKLLAQLNKEREKCYEEQFKAWKIELTIWEKNGCNGVKPIKPKKQKVLPVFTDNEIKYFKDLPKYWRWVKVDSIQGFNQNAIKAGPFGSSLKKECYVEKGYKIYGQEQVISGDWKIGNYFIDDNKFLELKSCEVKPNDILISLVGTVGKVLVLPKDIKPGIINPRLIKISLAEEFYLPDFFKYYFESSYLKSLYSLKSHGATMDIINLGMIQELPFPLLTIEEQKEVVKEIEARLSVCDNIQENIDEALKKSEALRQSILKKAFEGKLLSKEEIDACKREPDWEPADQLLKKIKKDSARSLE